MRETFFIILWQLHNTQIFYKTFLLPNLTVKIKTRTALASVQHHALQANPTCFSDIGKHQHNLITHNRDNSYKTLYIYKERPKFLKPQNPKRLQRLLHCHNYGTSHTVFPIRPHY